MVKRAKKRIQEKEAQLLIERSIYCFDFLPALPAALLGVAAGDFDRLRADVVEEADLLAADEDFFAGAFFLESSSSSSSSTFSAALVGAAMTFLDAVFAILLDLVAEGLPFDAAWGYSRGRHEDICLIQT